MRFPESFKELISRCSQANASGFYEDREKVNLLIADISRQLARLEQMQTISSQRPLLGERKPSFNIRGHQKEMIREELCHKISDFIDYEEIAVGGSDKNTIVGSIYILPPVKKERK